MANPYVGEVRIFAGNYAPVDWMFCNGQILSISQYQTLFSLIGTTYGGDGQTTFALPNMQSRALVHQGSGYTIGQQGGVESVTLSLAQAPSHAHGMNATNTAGTTGVPGPTTALASTPTGEAVYDNAASNQVNLASAAISAVGGSQPHANRQPYLAVNYIISLFGIYPTQN